MLSANSDDLDRQDMARLAGDHDAALNDLMERHAQRLFGYLLRLCHNETEASELAQESFVHVWQARTRYRPDHRFSTWLYAIATNLWRDQQRWRLRHPAVSLEAALDESGRDLKESLPASGPAPDEIAHAGERAALVRQAVAALPEDLRTPLVLAEYEGLSQAEIAQVLDCTPKAVEMRIYRARQHLRERLARLL
jgi:RNA polymerase sigma-70 factor, ECF subfamily